MHARFAAEGERVFLNEDGPMIAAVQASMGDRALFQLRPILLRTDEAAIRVRRRLEALIAAETNS
jgi:vanillate O-demethylase monooxygenase subunit